MIGKVQTKPKQQYTNDIRPKRQRWWWIGDWGFVRPLVVEYFRRGAQWPSLLALLPVIVIIAADIFDWQYLIGHGSKARYEDISIPLVAAAAAAWLLQAWLLRSRFCLLVGLQAVFFTCREIHFVGTKKGIYIATALMVFWTAVWAWRYRRLLIPSNINWRQISWLAASVSTYAVALLIQRRAFKSIPGEGPLHVPLEEATETAAHVLLLVAALVGSWRQKKSALPQSVEALDKPS